MFNKIILPPQFFKAFNFDQSTVTLPQITSWSKLIMVDFRIVKWEFFKRMDVVSNFTFEIS